MMAAVIKLPVEHVWTGASAIFYDLLEYLVEHITQPDSLARSLAFGLHSGTKFCNLSDCGTTELATLKEEVIHYKSELSDRSKAWLKPEYLNEGIHDIERLLELLTVV